MIAPHSVIRWSDALLLGVDFVDHDHQEAVETINRMAALAVDGKDLTAEMTAFRQHCQEHFAREEDMMARTGFFAIEPHSDEHHRVLAEADGIIAKLRAGESCLDYFTEALPQWFLEHRATMDFVTADFARERGWTSAA
ncbi:hemerythrin [Paramagnetospirillum kuznetsovii]|uniref:Hemerythrin n=1 Tax=Paramagnetospirillum kuznetsovii TaxID=2053833 RepID=A0A364NXJ5_9PROT|nr:hemerythrin family protein [Paramagnetospirillum kuznetsovii]RAU21766.1 hemerythrin [Paramagnetospirillum kuznetsovii]